MVYIDNQLILITKNIFMILKIKKFLKIENNKNRNSKNGSNFIWNRILI